MSSTSNMSAQHRAALEAAVAGLPTADDESWDVPDACLKASGLTDDVSAARKFVLQFSLWARSAISRMPQCPSTEMQATDFNDYYKIVMSRVQFVYANAMAGAAPGADPKLPLCSFQTQLRRRPAFRKGGAVTTSCVFDLSGSHKPSNGATEGSLEGSKANFRATLAAVGARKFDRATLKSLISQRSAKAVPIEESLAPVNDAWMDSLHGRCLFTLLPEGADFSGGSDVECKMVVDNGHAVRRAPLRPRVFLGSRRRELAGGACGRLLLTPRGLGAPGRCCSLRGRGTASRSARPPSFRP